MKIVAAFCLIAATQQSHRRYGVGYNKGPADPFEHQWRDYPWNLPSQVHQSLTSKQHALLNELRKATCIRDNPSDTPRFQAKGDGGDQYEGISCDDNSLRDGSCVHILTSCFTSVQSALVLQMKKQKCIRTGRSHMKKFKNLLWRPQLSLLSRSSFRKRIAVVCRSAGWPV